MIAAERHARIIDRLERSGIVLVEDLAQELGVSAMTVRRDLDKLRKQGHLHRCHGGAVLTDMVQAEEAYDTKMASRLEEKLRIAQACAAMVQEGDTVFLDAGTTTHNIAQSIRSKQNITIITNDLKIACSLLDSSVSLIMCGGQIQNSTGSAVGPIGWEMLGQMRVSIAFIGAACIDEDFNLLTPTIEKSFFKRTAMGIANRSYLVADSSKFFRHALVKIASMADFTATVTDKAFTPAEQKKLREKQIDIIPV